MLIAYTHECVSRRGSILIFTVALQFCLSFDVVNWNADCDFSYFHHIRIHFATVVQWCSTPDGNFECVSKSFSLWVVVGSFEVANLWLQPANIIQCRLKSIFRICYCLIMVIPFTNAENVRKYMNGRALKPPKPLNVSLKCFRCEN